MVRRVVHGDGGAYEPPGPADAWVYWRAWHSPSYALPYPPPALLLFAPAAILPFPVFSLLWHATLLGAGAWLLWPLPGRLRLPAFIAVTAISAWGNVATLLAVPLALTPRYPALWGVLAWTKITPAVGAISLVRQRRWRALAVVVVPSAILAAAVLLLVPGITATWIEGVRGDPGLVDNFMWNILPFKVSAFVRLPVAAAIAFFGASRPWTLAVAAAVATPNLSFATCGLLAAFVRLREERPEPGGRGRVDGRERRVARLVVHRD